MTTVNNWAAAVSGNWTTAANWSTGLVPGSSDDVFLGILGTYTVSLTNSAQTVNSLTISNKAATLAIAAPGQTESIIADLSNSGKLNIDATGSGGTTVSVGGGFTNTGTVTLGNIGETAASALKVLGGTTN